MLSALKLQLSNPSLKSHSKSRLSLCKFASRRRLNFQLSDGHFASLSVDASSSEPSIPQHFTATVGSSPPSSLLLPHWNVTQRHILILNIIACAAAVSATWLFCSAIPTLLAFKRAAESLEKLLDATREEVPDTMAAVRLSGMEISDLTMELSDLSQGITQGVRSSTQAVRVVEERLQKLTNKASSAPTQEKGTQKTETAGPMVARTARDIRDRIVKGRSLLQTFLTFARYSWMALNYITSRRKC